MKIHQQSCLFIILLLSLLNVTFVNFVGAAQSSSVVAGRVTFVEGEVQYKRTFRSPEEAVTINTTVNPGTKVATGSTGRVEITLRDESIVRLGPNSVYRIKIVSFKGGKTKSFRCRFR